MAVLLPGTTESCLQKIVRSYPCFKLKQKLPNKGNPNQKHEIKMTPNQNVSQNRRIMKVEYISTHSSDLNLILNSENQTGVYEGL